MGLNSMAGLPPVSGTFDLTQVQRRCLKYLLGQARLVIAWDEKISELAWDDFFAIKGIDYKGDEVLVAKYTEWANVRPALPKEVGMVELKNVVSLGLIDYVLGFEEFLLPPEDQIYVKPPRVMVPPESWEEMAKGLIKARVCSIIGEDEIFRVQGKLLLNGMFGVSKQEFEGGVEIHRLIMNLVPVNQLVRSVDGDICTLPSWSCMTPLHLGEDDQLLISSEDVRCFFYIFRTPSNWRPFMAFNKPLPPGMRPAGGKDQNYYLGSDVLPMGFKNSASIAQNIHRNIASWSGSMAAGFLGESAAELRKDRAFPTTPTIFRLYLDNFDLLERCDPKSRFDFGTA